MSRRRSNADLPNQAVGSLLRGWPVGGQFLGPAVIAAIAFVWICTGLDAAGGDPQLREGPGVTIDEVFNVQEGVLFVAGLRAYGPLGLTHPDSIREVFGHLPDHPPLGRWWIGIVHDIVNSCRWDRSPDGHWPDADVRSQFVINSARVAPASAFALLIVTVGFFASRWYGQTAGLLAAASLLAFPRLVGHAHLAVLEMFIALTYTLAVLMAAELWGRATERSQESASPLATPPGWQRSVWLGIVVGLALLTKIQAIFLPIPLVVWAIWQWRARAVVPLVVCGLVSGIVFFAGWPWLWLDPMGNTISYFASTTDRASLTVWYLGQSFADREVPWHYPWVMTAVTVPVGILAMVGYGLWRKRDMLGQPTREMLLLANILFPLLVFSLPGVAVYDGVRLFLVAFPLMAVFAGCGAARLWEIAAQREPIGAWQTAFVVFFASQFAGLWMTAPCFLSYYNLTVAGLSGAEALGFETTYWGDSLTRSLLEETAERLPIGSDLAVAPVLHPFQLETLLEQCPSLRARGIQLTADMVDTDGQRRPVLVFFRRSALPKGLRELGTKGDLAASVRRQGTTLAGLALPSATASPSGK